MVIKAWPRIPATIVAPSDLGRTRMWFWCNFSFLWVESARCELKITQVPPPAPFQIHERDP